MQTPPININEAARMIAWIERYNRAHGRAPYARHMMDGRASRPDGQAAFERADISAMLTSGFLQSNGDGNGNVSANDQIAITPRAAQWTHTVPAR